MNLLTAVQTFCGLMKLASPTVVVGNGDPQIVQILKILEQSGQNIADRGNWQELVKEAPFTTTASEDQGSLSTLAPFGYKNILWWTLWDRTAMLPLLGPLSPSDWQTYKAIQVTGPRFSFRLRGNRFLVSPAPAAGFAWVFEYASEFWISDVAGTVFRESFIADTDIILLRWKIVLADMQWRWEKAKGLDYAEDFNTAERYINNALARSANVGVLSTDTNTQRPTPGIFVPTGSWPIP